MIEYAFDVKLFAVARVTANSTQEARNKIRELQIIDIDYDVDGIKITEASTDGEPDLFAINGVLI